MPRGRPAAETEPHARFHECDGARGGGALEVVGAGHNGAHETGCVPHNGVGPPSIAENVRMIRSPPHPAPRGLHSRRSAVSHLAMATIIFDLDGTLVDT